MSTNARTRLIPQLVAKLVADTTFSTRLREPVMTSRTFEREGRLNGAKAVASAVEADVPLGMQPVVQHFVHLIQMRCHSILVVRLPCQKR